MRSTILAVFLLAAAAGQVLAAVSLSETSGRVYYLKAGSTVWAQVATGLVLGAGDRVRADKDSKAVVDFGDGSRVEIGANSSFTLQDSRAEETTLQVSIGRLRAWVSKRIGQRFSVRTPTAVCSVRGTEFAVDVNPQGNTRVEMFEGILAVADNKGNELLLKENQQVDVTSRGMGKVEGEGAGPSGAEQRRDAARREVALEMTKEEVQAAAALEQKSAIYQQGKAIIDVNGNRVRIEEYIVRSRPDEFKLVVLNDRASRFDYFYYRGTFNTKLPDDISVALRQLPGCADRPCDYFLTSFDTGRSNTQDYMRETATGGHLVDVNNNGVAADRVEAAYDPASDEFRQLSIPNPGGVGNQSFFQTLFNNNTLLFNGVQHGGWTPSGVAPAACVPPLCYAPGAPALASYALNSTTHITEFAGATATLLRREPVCGPPNCTYKESGLMHEVFYSESNDGKTWDKYDNYIISDEGRVAQWADFANITSGTSYKQTLLKWNFQTIVTAVEFNGRKIDLAVEPKIFIQSGLIQ